MTAGPFSTCIFQTPWWLDAVAPGSWSEVVVMRGAQAAARLPYVMRKRLGFTLCDMPPLTQTLGPWLRPSNARYARKLAEQKDLMGELIEELPPFDYFRQNLHHSLLNALPFHWKGFNVSLRYTYVLDDLSDLDRVWGGTLENIRTDVRKAQKTLVVRDDLGLDAFLRLNALTFSRQGRKLPYSEALVRRLDAACAERNARRMLFAEDAQGRVHAAVYVVWDDASAYYLMSGGDPALRSSGATSLLVWEAIRFAAGVTGAFDFEGSMIEPVERFFRAFGARQAPYVEVTKVSSRLLRVALDARGWLRPDPARRLPRKVREASGTES